MIIDVIKINTWVNIENFCFINLEIYFLWEFVAVDRKSYFKCWGIENHFYYISRPTFNTWDLNKFLLVLDQVPWLKVEHESIRFRKITARVSLWTEKESDHHKTVSTCVVYPDLVITSTLSNYMLVTHNTNP